MHLKDMKPGTPTAFSTAILIKLVLSTGEAGQMSLPAVLRAPINRHNGIAIVNDSASPNAQIPKRLLYLQQVKW